ncbi:hypothetical protein SAMN05428962_3395 [Paenibacillus sp. BC26]|nr:hypothetical protein SAMN05428962_3395 [Paenibacillus sp. BC26]
MADKLLFPSEQPRRNAAGLTGGRRQLRRGGAAGKIGCSSLGMGHSGILHLAPAPGFRFPAPDIWHSAPYTSYSAFGIRHPTPITPHPTAHTSHPHPTFGVRHSASYTGHTAFGFWHLTPNTRPPNPGINIPKYSNESYRPYLSENTSKKILTNRSSLIWWISSVLRPFPPK